MRKSFLSRTILTVITCAILVVTYTGGAIRATEATDEAPTCTIVITIADETGGQFKDTVEVKLVDKANNKSYTGNYTSDCAALGFSVPIGITLDLYISFPSNGIFLIQNTDGTAPQSFTTAGETLYLDWKVVENSPLLANPDAPYFVANTPNEEANQVFNEYMKTAILMYGDSGYDRVFDDYTIEVKGNRYVEYTGGTIEEWNSMSLFERFIRYELYVNILYYHDKPDADPYWGSIDSFRANVADQYGRIAKVSTEQAEAYRIITDWIYYLRFNTGGVVNFFENVTIDNPAVDGTTTPQPTTPKETSANTTTTDTAPTTISPADKANDEKGLWDGVAKGVRSNFIPIIIALAVLAFLFVRIWLRKRKGQ